MDARRRRSGRDWRKAGAVVVALGVVGVATIEAPAQEAAEQEARAQAEAQRAQLEEQAQRILPDDAAPDAPVAPADGEAADDIDDAELLEGFRVAPASFNVSSNLHFDDEGNVRNEHHNMGMNLNVYYDAAFPPRAYRNLKIDRFVTDAGEELNVQHHNSGEQMIHHHRHHGNQSPRFNLGFQLSRPKQAAEVVRRLEGSVEVILPVGEPRHAVLGPVGEILGKQVHIANFPGSELQISRQDSRMMIQMNSELASLLTEVRFYDADGREKPSQHRGTGRSGDQHHHYYEFDVPEDGQIMLTFLSETRVLRVPFELKDIPLPQPGGSGGIDLVIRAEAGNPLARNVGPAEGDLDVEIE